MYAFTELGNVLSFVYQCKEVRYFENIGSVSALDLVSGNPPERWLSHISSGEHFHYFVSFDLMYIFFFSRLEAC